MVSTLQAPVTGDEARLSVTDEITRARAEMTRGNRKYLQVVEFDGKDPLEEEQRRYIPVGHKPEITKIRGSIAFERDEVVDHGSSSQSSQTAAVIHVNWPHMGGTNWNAVGYWRGSLSSTTLNSTSSQANTLLDLLNRTYQIGLFYSNPEGNWNLGFGRLFVPGATSLGVFDGGYVVRKLNNNVGAGFFAGTAPDPTQWNYAPNRQTVGSFVKYEKGSFDTQHWYGTIGVALDRVNWRPERQYLFAENSFSFGRVFSFFETLQADQRNPKLMNGQTGVQLSQSFATLRIQPSSKISFDVNHNYLRGVPTFDSRLLGTGLLDQYLFTGFSGTMRVQPINQLLLTASLGESRQNGETTHALNQFYGVAWKRIPWVELRVDARYNRFNSGFGTGNYRSLALSRELFDNLVRLEFEGGVQEIRSTLANQGKAHYFNTTVDWQLARHYFMDGGWLYYRGQSQNYDQIYVSLGYRFR